MHSKLTSFGILGIEAFSVDVEVDCAHGLPAVTIVGLADAGVKESKERIKAAIKNSGFRFPASRITINLAPADTRKEGPLFDLAIALGILASSQQIDTERLTGYVYIGELSLKGDLRPVKGILPIALKLNTSGIRNLIVPYENAPEAAMIPNIKVFGMRSLKETVHFIHAQHIAPTTRQPFSPVQHNSEIDFVQVKGQTLAKRAIEVAVAGGHNILMIGSPGSGKSMLAKRIPTIIPNMNETEMIETTCIHSSAGLLTKHGLMHQRPFRAPHHSISDVALIGGGSIPQPGEITLSHNGVLFLDELPEFRRNVLEALRQPLEDGCVHIARAHKALTFPARFMLTAAMNPCPCGYLSDSYRQCNCTTTKIERYLSKISGPLLDRIDIHIEVPTLAYNEFTSKARGESSQQIKERIVRARALQTARFSGGGIFCNAYMKHNQIKQFCQLSDEAHVLLISAMEELKLSARAYDKILKVSRTIADVEGIHDIQPAHIAEAIAYRSLDRQLWIR